jgi:hypothetical protein
MNGRLPIEGQNVQVKLKEGDWQDAVYRDAKFIDLYGLPLGAEKISEWRSVTVAPAMNGASRIQRSSLKTAVSPLN